MKNVGNSVIFVTLTILIFFSVAIHPISGKKVKIPTILLSCLDAEMKRLDFPRIYQDNENLNIRILFVCAFGLYNYNINIAFVDNLIVHKKIIAETKECLSHFYCQKQLAKIVSGKMPIFP